MKEIYVDHLNGNDETGDGTSERPYRTVDKAMSSLEDHGAD